MEEFSHMQKCNVMELLPFFLDSPMDAPPINVTPSRLLSELQMPMQKRFEQLTKSTRKRRIITEMNTFIRNPDIVVFQNFEEYQTYKTTLSFVNTKPASKNLRIGLEYKSPFLEIVRPVSDLDFNKVAPGIAYVVTIIFTPTEMRDYVATLVCDTNEETFSVPIYALSTRPLLKIVDELRLNPTAVRVTSEKSILLHNLADIRGHYRVSVEEPFDVIPKKEVIKPNQAHELKVSCIPITAENPNSFIIVHCLDFVMKIPVSCEIQEADIFLQKGSVDFFEVFVGLQNYSTTTVHNNSPFTIDFRWKLLPSEKEDVKRIKSIIKNLESLTEMEKQKYVKLEYNEIIHSEGHQQILDYKFREYAENINDEFKLMYTNEAFSIIPMEGRILPHQSFDFNVIFAPTKNDVYLSSAYLDVTGKHERFHLYLSGIGKGPTVIFNVNKLNTGTIFLEAEHEYQVVVKNEGWIPATLIFQQRQTQFGGEINCNPEYQHMKKNDCCKTFIISFSSKVQGPFVEKVHFKIKESQEIIYFLLIGNVVCPLLKPDVDKLDFGKIPFGTEITKYVVLTNPSQVRIDFVVKMSNINYAEMISNGTKEIKPDFTYNPEQGFAAPYGNSTVEVKLLTNVIDTVRETMIIGMYGSDLYNIQIPCIYTSLIPIMTCEPQDVYITFCFLNFEYKRKLKFTNITSITGQFNYAPLEEPSNMRIDVNPTEFYVTPGGEFTVELTISTDVLGLHEYPLMFIMVGQEKPTRYCNLKCNGQGPVVSYFPDDIILGAVQLLTTAVKQISFVNDSPIKAKIYLSSTNKSVVQLPIEELDLAPECEVKVDVVCFLTEDGKFGCQILVDIENGENIIIKVTGEGIGHPIKCVPKLEPVYDMGSKLTYLTNHLSVAISNLGKKYYKIFWSRKSLIKSLKELMEEEVLPNGIFWFEPRCFELKENCKENVVIYARSRTPFYYEEIFYMYATIDVGSKIVTPILNVLLKVNFIVPVISFSTQQLKFIEMHVPEVVDPFCPLEEGGVPLKSISTREVVIRNEVEIPLKLVMHTTDDFLIKLYHDEYEDTYHHELEVGREVKLTIEFQPRQFSKRYLRTVGKLTVDIPEYPKTESIYLTGEMCFPSIKFLPHELNFGCMEFGSSSVKRIIIQNITFLPVKYSLKILMDSFHLQKIPELYSESSSRFSVQGLPTETFSINTEMYNEKQRTEKQKESTDKLVSDVFVKQSLDVGMVDEQSRQPVIVIESPSEEEIVKQETSEQQTISSKKTDIQSGEEDYKSLAESEQKHSRVSIGSDTKMASDEAHISQDILSRLSEIDPEHLKTISKTVLNNLLFNKYEEVDATEIHSRDFWMEMESPDVNSTYNFKNIITMEPWRGCLKPYEYGIINVYFDPPPNTRVQCTAVCRIEGGEQEPINIYGSSSNIVFSFDKNFIDVGRKLFCEVLETSITLTNDGHYEFPIVARCDDEEIFFNKKIKPKWLSVQPKKYFLEASKSVTFKVRYFPGITGMFQEDITFDIAFLEPVKIPLQGYAVFSQVILNVPRQELNQNYRKLQYLAIGSLNEKYFLSEIIRKKKTSSAMGKMSGVSMVSRLSGSTADVSRMFIDDPEDPKFKCLEEDRWEVIYRHESMPTARDLDLALERTLLNEQLTTYYDNLKKHSITRKYKVIPDFKVPKYRLNFGNVHIDTTAVITLNITNVGPEPTTVKVQKSNLLALFANDMSIEYNRKVLEVGDMLHMHIIFRPSNKSANYSENDDKCIQEIFNLMVSHGATIPVMIAATVALPKLSFLYKCIDFGMVKLGNAFRQTVIMENQGSLMCYWDAEVRSLNDMKPLYYVIPSKGEILPFEKGIMNIYFVPKKKGFYSAEIIVHLHGNSKQVRLKLGGDGVQPTLVFKDANMTFNPCIPYSTQNEELLIQNVSTYPIEFCFSDFEQYYDEEKMLVDLFLNYNNLKTLFIPSRELGTGIPEIFLSTYQMLEADLRKTFKTVQYEDGSEVDVLADYTKEQIVELIKQYIDTMIEVETNQPYRNSTDIYPVENKFIEGLAIIEPTGENGSSQKKGVVIIFHGAPETEYTRAAFTVSRYMKGELYSIDKLICEELVHKKSHFSEIINNLIDETLTEYEEQIEITECDDEYDILLKKLDIIKNSQPLSKKQGTKGPKGKLKVKIDEKESTKSKKNLEMESKTQTKIVNETFLDVPPEIYANLLKNKFEKMSCAMIIESLNSIFIFSPLTALECLLHGIGNMRYIEIFVLSLTLEEYITNEAKRILDEEAEHNEVVLEESHPESILRKEKRKETSTSSSKRSGSSTKSSGSSTKISSSFTTPSLSTIDHKLDEKIQEITSAVPQELDEKFKTFGNFLLYAKDLCEAWDKKNCVLKILAPTSMTKIDKKIKKKTIISGAVKFTSIVIVDDLTLTGIPLMIVDKDLSTWINPVLDMNHDLNAALEEMKSFSKECIQESSFMYSVVTGISRFNKKFSDVFKMEEKTGELQNTREHEQEQDQASYKGLSTISSVGTSRAKRKKYPEISNKGKDQDFCTRTIIAPGEILKYGISFNPQYLGEFTHKYRLEIIGYRHSIFIKCQANSDLPKLNYTPEDMFSKCIECVVDKQIGDHFVYIKDIQMLDFGTVIHAHPNANLPPYSTKIVLKNNSKITCETTVDLTGSDFVIMSNKYEIPPEKEVELEIYLQATRIGHVDSELYIVIKNNPMVYRLKLTSEIVPIDFTISPKGLIFDKIPLDYCARQYIKLTNSTSVNLKWKFVKCDWATKIYKIHKLRGIVNLYSTEKIEFEFKPIKEETYPSRTIDIQIFDPLCSEDIPVLVDSITLLSEAVEYLVKYKDHVELGELKGKCEYKFPLDLSNNGKTVLLMVIDKIVNPSDTNFRKIRRNFQYSVNSEIVQPQKHSGIIIKFNPTEEMDFKEVPIFCCKILDPNKPDNVVISFQIKYSATILLSKFSICPASNVHFGSLEVFNKRTQILQLKNTGKSKFTYTISYVNPTGTVTPLVNEATKQKTTKKRRGESSVSNLKTTDTLEMPGYTICPFVGIVQGGENAEITLTFHPTALGIYEQTMLINVSEPAKEHINGKEIILYGEASEPWIDFQNFNKVFKEHYIVNSPDELVVPSDIGTHTYFVVSKNTLYFENVCVKKECQAKIYLQNLGQLVAVVTGKVYQCNNFTVSPAQFTIDPYLTGVITVTFRPDSINTFEGRLELGSNATTNNNIEIYLRGRSYAPQIELSGLPPLEGTENLYKVHFRSINIKETETQRVKITNTGVIMCQVIIALADSGTSMFHLLQSDNLLEFSKEQENKEENFVSSSLKITLYPSESTYVCLVFKPDKEVMIDTLISIYIVENPFETYQIQVFAHCYSGDIYIDSLEARKAKGNNTTVVYILDFGHTPLKQIPKKRFKIRNNSDEKTYRFEFNYNVDTIKFIPRVGHIKPLSFKEILVVNISNVPRTFIKEVITFQYIPIRFLTEETVAISWDERQQLLSWLETGIGIQEDAQIQQHFRNCVDTATETFLKSEDCKSDQVKDKLKLSLEREEPDVVFTSDEWQTNDILLSLTTDYAIFTNSTKKLHFPETFVRDKNELEFKIINCGKVPLYIKWKIVVDDISPKYPSIEIIKPIPEDDPSFIGEVCSFESCLSSSISQEPESEYIDYSQILQIIPMKTEIPMDKEGKFTVVFSPRVACKYTARLISHIDSLHPGLKNIIIPIISESFLPEYYFELEESDYLLRRTKKRCLKIYANLKILEIQAVGIGVTTVKRFYVLNTSYFPLNFKLEPIVQGNLSFISCKTPSGTIEKGKKFELVFAFTSRELGTFEEDYMFTTDRIPLKTNFEKSSETEVEPELLQTQFLVVGICKNPRVYFKTAHINLTPTLLRIPTHETIYLNNDEDDELEFKILKESLYSYDHLQKLKIVPNSGCIPPKTQIAMQLVYNAETTGDSTFSIQCVVARMTSPLTLNISTKCLQVKCKIHYINQSGEETTLDPNNENFINLGKIGIKTKTTLSFIFTNTGKTGFFYTWHYKKKHIEHLINISPKKDKEFVPSGTSVKREVAFETYKKYNLTNYPMKIEISYGPVYNLKLFVAAEFPTCKLSFVSFNFGNCLIQPFFTKNYTEPLVVKNLEPYPVKLDNFFEENENLTVDFKSELIQPQCKAIIPFYFHPRKEGQYEFMVPFILNCTKRFIKITGTGVKINLQLMNPSDKFIDLGEVKMGETRRYTFFVINKTPTQLDTTLFLSQDFPLEKKEFERLRPEIVVPVTVVAPAPSPKDKKHVVEVKETRKGRKTNENLRLSLSDEENKEIRLQVAIPEKSSFFIEPKDSVKMDFNKKYQFVVEFRPSVRLEKFSQKIFYKIQEFVAPLCLVKGKCLVPEFSLDKEILTFSNVVIGMTRLKFVLLRNTGDLPIRFKWQFEHLENFTVHPIEGYMKPKSDIKVDFSFKANTVIFQSMKKCICIINNKHPLELTLVANSIHKPPISTVTFSCPVRQQTAQNVEIENITTTLWHLYPIITNKNFKVPSEIVVEPESVSTVRVKYYPKQIIDEKATLILILPDEEILYEFIGIPLPPLPEKKMSIEIRSKHNHCQILPVHNWTDLKKHFEVETILTSLPTTKTLYKTFGLDSIILLPGETKEYKWNIYAINEEHLDLQVKFKDSKNPNEYMFYEIAVKVLPPDPIDTVNMVTCIRKPVKGKINLKNPINIPVEYQIVSPCSELQFQKVIPMEPYSKQELEVTYYPVKNGEFVTTLDARCEELGVFSYTLNLTANMPEVQKILKFVVELGERGYATTEIKNKFSVPMDVSIKFNDPEFTMEKYPRTVSHGETASFSVCFEPSDIGLQESTLIISSTVSGPYVFQLHGECIPPTPKGPFLIKYGGIVLIPFFNPFNETQEFTYSLDSKMFELKISSEEIKSRKPTKIIVSCSQSLKGQCDISCLSTGKLLVSGGNVKWTFYIQME